MSTDGGSTWSTATAATSTVTFSLVFTTYGGTINYFYRVRKPGYVFINTSGSATYATTSVPITQAQLLDANGQPIYGYGVATSLVSIDGPNQRIDIGNGSVNGPDLFDFVVNWECTTTGIIYAEAKALTFAVKSPTAWYWSLLSKASRKR